MEHPRIDFPEVAGKTVTELSVFDDPTYGQEVLVRFTDETQLSICIGVTQTIDARYSLEETPDVPILTRTK